MEEDTAEVIWGGRVIDEVQEVDAAGRVMEEKEGLEILSKIKKKNHQDRESTPKKAAANPTWRKHI